MVQASYEVYISAQEVIIMIDGNLIKTLRREKGLSQEELGDLVGTEGNLVSRWERGASVPSPSLTTCTSSQKS